MNLRQTIRNVQLLENAAADKAGAAFLVMDDMRMGDPKYRAEWIEKLLTAIGPEVLKAAQEGKKLSSAITGTRRASTAPVPES